jgi:hypothetical protein
MNEEEDLEDVLLWLSGCIVITSSSPMGWG